MTVIFRNTDSIASGNALTLTAGDVLFVTRGVNIASTASDGVFSSGGVTVENHGTIFGDFNGLEIGATGQTTSVFNGSDGIISGGPGEQGMTVTGTYVISNYGQINCPGFNGYGVYTSGPGAIYNYGSITAGFGIISSDSVASDTVTTYNYGTVTGSAYSYYGNANALERLINAGTMTGDIRLGTGTGDIFDSSLGRIFGTITCGIGGDTVVGATNGGAINGGSGADVLIANQSQTAANNAAKTTLDGKTGINALYGGGAFTTFIAGDTNGGYNQIWGGASQMTGVYGYVNNTLSFAVAPAGVFVDLLNGHNAYVGSTVGGAWAGTGTYEDSIVNVPNVIGSAFGDVIQADNGVDRVTGGGKADQLYAGSGANSQDTFVYTGYSDSNTVTGYDTVIGFKIGTDKIDLSALSTSGAHLSISTNGLSNTLYVMQTPGVFNAATDLAMIVNTSTAGGLTASDFVF
jgi:hypothetical protein